MQAPPNEKEEEEDMLKDKYSNISDFPRSSSFLKPPTCNLYNPETTPHLPWVSSSPWPINYVSWQYTQPSPLNRPKGLLLLPFSSFFSSIRIRVKGRDLAFSYQAYLEIQLHDEESHGFSILISGLFGNTTTRRGKSGEYNLSSTSGTRVYIDLDIPKTAEFKDQLVENNQPIGQMPKQFKPQLTIQEEMNINKTTISEITKMMWDSDNEV
ncbi:hypothetical protein CMV_011356 [Castanea mollissima]|uniref:Uncharacterized protein n=1 Tax=Castanea mollissima TaxID=60419 RepID=A0A8J4RLG1_9ROSI|nr:hypothetical protein CMV_011356 [Castanea mollissima]